MQRIDRVAQQSEFAGAPDEGLHFQTLTAPRPDLRTDLVHEHRHLLAFERERPGGANVEQRQRLIEHGGMRVDRTRRRFRSDARRGVRGIAHCGVGGAGGCADLGRERMPAIHTHLYRQRQLRIGDATQCTQHYPFVVFLRERHAGAKEELAAVAIDVDRQQCHAFRVEMRLNRSDGCM